VTVSARDAFGHIATGYTGTVTFSTSDPDPGVVLPADYTFTPADGGIHTFTNTGLGETTLVTPGAQTITATDTADDTITGSAVTTVSTTPLLVSNYVNPGYVAEYDAGGGHLSDFVPPGSSPLNLADALAFGPDNQLYVVSQGTHNVLRYDGQSGAFLGPFASQGLVTPIGLAFGPDGNLYVSDANSNSVLRYDGTTGTLIDTFVARGSGGLSSPHGITFGPDGNLYVNSSGTNAVLFYDGQTGAYLGNFVAPRAGGLQFPQDLLFGPDGNLYVSGINSSSVCRYDGQTGTFIDVFAQGGPLSGASGLAFSPDGNLYVGSINNNKVLRYDGQTGQFLDVFADTGLNRPVFLTFQSFHRAPPGPGKNAPGSGRTPLPAWALAEQPLSPGGTLAVTPQAQPPNGSEPLAGDAGGGDRLVGSLAEEEFGYLLAQARHETASGTDWWALNLS
jgi:WD40 repeat protein